MSEDDKGGITMDPVPEPEEEAKLGTPKGDTLAVIDYAKKKASHFNKHKGWSMRHEGITGAKSCDDCFILDAIERLESLLRPKPKKPVSLIIQ